VSARGSLGLSRALVVGLARSGSSAALALRAAGCEVVGVDSDVERDVGRLAEAGVEVHLGGRVSPVALEDVEVVVKSPGVPANELLTAHARRAGVPIWSEVELGARLLPQRIAGVTGTNGKTTTCELLGEMVRASGREAAIAGNVGRPLTSVDPDDDPEAWVVCELSSFQLEDIDRFRAHVAVLLNVTPDHLDRHKSFEAYRDAKLRVFENQLEEDVAVVPQGVETVPGRGRRLEFAALDELPQVPRIPGVHNRENAAAATLAARAMGVPDDAIGAALTSFRGLPHRLEVVGSVDGVRYINDSKATNPEAAEQALDAFPRARVILGGSKKGSSFERLATAARASSVRRAYLIGEAAPAIAAALEQEGVPYIRVENLESAVAAAASDARRDEVVLLAPACASFDQFRDYEHRGDVFRQVVSEL
jgi:UDP-N-acetylmuramoylalanine--D-glutamate ligase